MSELIRRARPGDEAEIVAMIRELAEFEHSISDLEYNWYLHTV